MHIPDYYQLLEIGRDATLQEIKRAYRRLAKRYHPDKNPTRPTFSEKMFREVSDAYRTLTDTARKSEYDRTLHALDRQRKVQEAYLRRLNTSERMYAKIELLLQALFHRHYETGVSMYEQLQDTSQKNGKRWCIDDFLSYEESRDCEFLVAEAYQKLGFADADGAGVRASHNLQQAMSLYESLLSAETRRPCFRHFIREVKERLKFIYLHHFSADGYDPMRQLPLAKIEALALPKRETAWMYKKIAEFYVEIDRFPEARAVLKMAFTLQPDLAGAKKVCRALNMGYEAGR